ncbi:MAG: PhzF family phenazine biosynthesis protein [Bacteroidales bacterium]|nr:PhzF family phenazine biosynthesis protein [Bacteroidales bacterium]
MKKTIYQVDAFTGEPFKGNPAAVMLGDEDISTKFMQNIAMEMNLSETAFLFPEGDNFRIRYFTPTMEVPLCGHATLSSAHIIYELGLKNPDETLFLKAKGADLAINKQDEWICMNFPKYPLRKIETPSGFQEYVGFEPVETYSSLYNWMIAIAPSETDIEHANPDFEKLIGNGMGHLVITAESKRVETDFVLRCFAPISGINEDPVTGSLHCALIPLWSNKLGKSEMNSLQLSSRSGRLRVKRVGNDRVEICGKAVTVFQAELKI